MRLCPEHLGLAFHRVNGLLVLDDCSPSSGCRRKSCLEWRGLFKLRLAQESYPYPCSANSTGRKAPRPSLFGRKKERGRSSKDGSGLLKVPQNFAEPLGFWRKALQNVSHSKKNQLKKGSAEPFFDFAELWEPNPAFQALHKFFSHDRRKTNVQQPTCKTCLSGFLDPLFRFGPFFESKTQGLIGEYALPKRLVWWGLKRLKSSDWRWVTGSAMTLCVETRQLVTPDSLPQKLEQRLRHDAKCTFGHIWLKPAKMACQQVHDCATMSISMQNGLVAPCLACRTSIFAVKH